MKVEKRLPFIINVLSGHPEANPEGNNYEIEYKNYEMTE